MLIGMFSLGSMIMDKNCYSIEKAICEKNNLNQIGDSVETIYPFMVQDII
jgi:hypothetical protein